MRICVSLFFTAFFSFLSVPANAEDQPAATRLSEVRGIWEAHFNHDASRVVTQTRAGVVAIWDAEKGTLVAADLEGESQRMSPDGRRVLVAGKTGGRVLDATTGQPISPLLSIQFADPAGPLAAFSPDGETLVAFEANAASIWRVGDGRKIADFPWDAPSETDSTDSPPSVVFAKDGAHCFLHDGRGTVQRYDAMTWKSIGPALRHPAAEAAYNFGVVVSDSGKWAATFDNPGENGPTGNLQIWDAGPGKPLGRPLTTINGFTAYFPAGTDRVVITPARGEGQVRELPSMKRAYAIRAHDDLDGPQVAISPDGKWILSWGPDSRLDLIDAATGKLAENVSSRAQVEKILFAPDSSSVYVVYENTAFLLEHHYDLYVMKMSLPELKVTGSIRLSDYLLRWELSPDGRRLLLLPGGSDAERIVIYDAVTMKPLN